MDVDESPRKFHTKKKKKNYKGAAVSLINQPLLSS